MTTIAPQMEITPAQLKKFKEVRETAALRTAKVKELRHNLTTAVDALNILNTSGFPTIREVEDLLRRWLSSGRLILAAKKLVDGTRHINHPALATVRQALAEIEEFDARSSNKLTTKTSVD
jgi:hypothetical protein